MEQIQGDMLRTLLQEELTKDDLVEQLVQIFQQSHNTEEEMDKALANIIHVIKERKLILDAHNLETLTPEEQEKIRNMIYVDDA